MSDDIAIKVEGLGKRYRLGERERYKSARDSIMRLFRPSRSSLRSEQEFWALKDVNFEVKRGEVLGIIGRNGAGKSTLLKVLSRITDPTEGRVEIIGRVGSLLEVGTGFHPELSGRENVFLNGAILGMREREIRAKFDEIVAFAEVEKFIDTPVKRYSSGMYTRLAFAVAAHLEPDILIVDEVLAVGDVEFQKKCMGKMQDVATHGRTVLFVSHNLQAVRSLCTAGLILGRGRIVTQGDAATCVAAYAHTGEGSDNQWERNFIDNSRDLQLVRASCSLAGHQPNLTLNLELFFHSRGQHRPAFFAIDITDTTETPLMQAIPRLDPFLKNCQENEPLAVAIDLPPLVPGNYRLSVWTGPHNTETYDEAKSILSFDVKDTPTEGRLVPHSPDHGWVVPHSRLIEEQSYVAETA